MRTEDITKDDIVKAFHAVADDFWKKTKGTENEMTIYDCFDYYEEDIPKIAGWFADFVNQKPVKYEFGLLPSSVVVEVVFHKLSLQHPDKAKFLTTCKYIFQQAEKKCLKNRLAPVELNDGLLVRFNG